MTATTTAQPSGPVPPASPTAARRLLLVHAHPDDEVITTGATMAAYAAEGAHVTLVTCTAGEEGEVLVPELAHLAADREDRLAEIRVVELANAMTALGVADHRFLGGVGCYRDSGMMGTPANDKPHAFWRADLDEAAAHLVKVVREIRPQVLVTYDENGGYGHPDHIQAHRVAMRAAELAADPAFAPEHGAVWDVAKIYWTAMPESVLAEGIQALKEAGDTSGFIAVESVEDLSFGTDDALVTTTIDGTAYMENKREGMRAYPTQISMGQGFFALSNSIGMEFMAHEFYQLVKGAAEGSDTGLEKDLFAGLGIADGTAAGVSQG
ncbi:1D-myo-inosityl-2-acetamido-2-deoxy-alpha-D-glucopyranoside deacetylase [Catenulispora acidiphila DSM 44928]|uniref:1D-myo-inositol 2-acetamido-2-deoxy-alpha-D-glucopyranoside deacetylase 1 n=1 Tax=Catenulispora acidiphila (strain DSM 44928 / JCM 14897 / NBRC 102108 / NRRL B-24433 / ID139908) TaxID=479433 RepID=MSHB1_CATAD|nr:N-acetyl-1-D-myo-inositol-2-amino-2-deoxy-alpha-D-glucopyranoside deacetylase [Catenulispora acidiphila]C7Q0R3.1 RecName: Full=1D-myo-inositol 2-acetamido-2-deoxy-alpha-D-glucopyranoside deacetylase 1; Short=GlcNAc-Ins deacetylase 1; AltName: Full=N-acetyl-1-D-myo-inositol 2-amino-2-deoxy-alpha-D-glucopyranoside deacetylase 1 [Catenulispora acidiphila DSM 44928]ACU69691.1 1D-myo-inosityl-2-acetamido-2-deoxy-alpha-D-glucopyranoside deacetylase [Catenulispora acidiphila DSM 44928]